MISQSDVTRLKRTPSVAEIAGRSSDPRWYAALAMLPNPDPILRRAGKDAEVFDAIASDAHVVGELRSIKADLNRFQHVLVPGDDSRKAAKALDLCQRILHHDPAPNRSWPNLIWNIGQAVFRGISVHELVWSRQGDWLLPTKILDRPQRRFGFDADNQLRLLTRESPVEGIPAEQFYFLMNRNMPSYDNPYGVALFSSCFWPYTFKHGGFRWFVKFCERFGIPFPVGKYPLGTQPDQIRELESALENLIEAGYAALSEGSAIELIQAQGAGSGSKLAQHQLIQVCNAEMSKALTSQTLATESPNSGSRAASESHRQRAADVNAGDREEIAFTLDHLWRIVTRVNLGEDVPPPRSEFRASEEVTKERAEVFQIFTQLGGNPSRKAMAAELGIKLANPKDDDDALQARAAPPNPTGAAVQFSQFVRDEFPDQAAIDAVNLDAQLQPLMEKLVAPLTDLVRDGMPPEAIKSQLAELYPQLDDAGLQALLTRALFVANVWGRIANQGESIDA